MCRTLKQMTQRLLHATYSKSRVANFLPSALSLGRRAGRASQRAPSFKLEKAML